MAAQVGVTYVITFYLNFPLQMAAPDTVLITIIF